MLERLNEEIKRRTHVVRIFPNAASCLRLIRALAVEMHENWLGENILQLLPDAVAPSKEEPAAYWAKVWKRALAHLGRRPLKLVRHVRGTTFYHIGKLPCH